MADVEPSKTISAEPEIATQVVKPKLAWGDSVKQWWNSPSLQSAEEAVLSLLPFSPENKSQSDRRVAKSELVKIDPNDDRIFLNEFQIWNPALEDKNKSNVKEEDTNIILLHGYGAGLGFFYQNFDGLSSLPGTRIHALDLPGFGRSFKDPKFNIKTKDLELKDSSGNFKAVQETEEWFCNHLYNYTQARKMKKFVLIGHSMGGYLAFNYALRHADQVEKLILVSPVGVERGNIHNITDESGHTIKVASNGPVPETEINPEIQPAKNKNKFRHETPSGKAIPNWFTYIWNHHFSVFSIIRASSFAAPKWVSNWSYWRFSNLPEEERDILHLYSYRLFSAKGSGEYAITRLLYPGAIARTPLIDQLNSIRCPTLWMYGDNDWMNRKAGREAVSKLQTRDMVAEYSEIKQAGHHVYLDNVEDFNQTVLNFIKKN
ncbi:alpha/beta-hydrolase [Nadsonia fulvescens var. elongata DSM 6958]|uniref:Alpha/beta-hydrolase n=1 Tax=Nadsonia fulvescens var. elongata DSM 6958 TaxID=857566 RepID=A0A1E3PMU3_9ASCO|nr:alpha/beta-hydrolase [Nadsonia fulvescens var. elongata DSM 6958]